MDIVQNTTASLTTEGGALSVVLKGIAAAEACSTSLEVIKYRSKKDPPANVPSETYVDMAYSEQLNFYFELMEVTPYLPAMSVQDAAAQVMLILKFLNDLADELPDEEAVNAALRKATARIELLAHSAVRHLEKSYGFSMEEMGLRNLRNPHLDPWSQLTDRLDMVFGKAGQ